MRLFRHLLFALNSAWQSFWRNAGVSVAAVISITLILILAGVNLLLGHALAGVLDSYKTRVSVISISVSDQTPLATVYDFKQQLEADPRVAGVTFVTKDEELQRFSADPRNRDLIANIEGNPVPAKLEVHVKNLSDVDAINNLGRTWRGADRTDPTDYQGDFIARMVKLSAWLTLAGYALMAILVVVSVVIEDGQVVRDDRAGRYHEAPQASALRA